MPSVEVKQNSENSESETKLSVECSTDTDSDTAIVLLEWENRKRALLKSVKKRTPKRKKQEVVSPDCSENELDYRNWKLDQTPVVWRQSLFNTIKLFQHVKKKPTTAESRLQKYCKAELKIHTSFDSPTCLMIAIRKCILTRNWQRLVRLLLIFVKFNKNVMYKRYLKEMCQLVFKLHPSNENGEVYENYERLMGIRN